MSDYIMHHGVRGQRWGVRRYQNEDGSWKSGAGESHNKAAQNRFDKTGGEKKKKVGGKLTERDKDLLFGVAGHMVRKHMAERKAKKAETPQEKARRQMEEAEVKYEKRRVKQANRKDMLTYGLVGHAIRKKMGKAEVEPRKKDSSVTRKVKKDFEELDDKQFMGKYKVNKKTYAKRVAKYGDPYENSPGTRWARNQNAKRRERNAAREEKAVGKALKKDGRYQYDIDSYKGHENGIYDKRGREMLSKQDVSDSVRSLQEKRLNSLSKVSKYKSGQKEIDSRINDLSSRYDIHYDKKKKKYRLSDKS